MKKAVFVIPIVVLIVVVLAAAAVLAFGGSKLKPFVQKHIALMIANPVEIGKISLGWNGNVSVTFSDVQILSETRERVATAKKIVLDMPLNALLKRTLDITSLKLDEPKLGLVEDASGWRVEGVVLRERVETPGNSKDKTQPTEKRFMHLRNLAINDGRILWTDQTSHPSKTMDVKDLDLTVKRVRSKKATVFEGSAALFGQEKNIEMEGEFLWRPEGAKAVSFDEFKIKADLSKMKIVEMAKFAPLQNFNLREDLRGEFNVVVTPEKTVGTVRKAHAWLQGWNLPLENLNMDFTIEPKKIHMPVMEASLGQGKFRSNITINTANPNDPQTEMSAQIENVALQQFLKPEPHKPNFYGNVSGAFAGRANGMVRPRIESTLVGESQVTISEAGIGNINLLRMVFDKLSTTPGADPQQLYNYLPPQYRQALQLNDTPLEPVQIRARISNGGMAFDDFRIATTGIEIFGRGQLGFRGDISLQTTLVLDQQLSQALVYGAPNLQYGLDANGRLFLPVNIFGTLHGLMIQPNYDHIVQRVVQDKGSELLGKMMKGTQQ